MFREEFLQTVAHSSSHGEKGNSLWQEIENAYAGKGRYYHNLAHLENLLAELKPYQSLFTNWSTVIFALAYHDVVYNTLRSNNEEKSAALAVQRLKELSFPADQIERCRQFIVATKGHHPADREINLFTDADLSVLGADAETYRNYAHNIRREYSLYPSLIYNHGRKKVVHHFLNMERIFKSDEFFSKYEEAARRNLKMELSKLKTEA